MVEAGGIRELISVRVAGYFLVRTSALIYLIVIISMKCKMEKNMKPESVTLQTKKLGI